MMTEALASTELMDGLDFRPVCDAHPHLSIPWKNEVQYVADPCSQPAEWLVIQHNIDNCRIEHRIHCTEHKDWMLNIAKYPCYCGEQRVIEVRPL